MDGREEQIADETLDRPPYSSFDFTQLYNLTMPFAQARPADPLPAGRKGDYKQEHMTRDTWGASITWEEWEEKARDHVDGLMARRR